MSSLTGCLSKNGFANVVEDIANDVLNCVRMAGCPSILQK